MTSESAAKMDPNPYATPAADLYGEASATLTHGFNGVAQSTLDQLRRTKLWARIVGIAVMLYGGLTMVIGAGLGVMSFFGGGLLEGEEAASEAYRFGFGLGVALIYGVAGFLIFYPGLKLNSYANRIGHLLREPTVRRLDEALQQQRLGLKFTAILVIIALAFAAVGVLIVLGAFMVRRAG